MSEEVQVERSNERLSLVLNRPERRNAVTVSMYAALAEAIEQADADPAIRLITLRGEGQDFTAGNDLADFMTALPRDGDDIPVWRLLRALARCTTPILAAAHGNCVGIGTTMLLHCDLVIAADSARFVMPFVDLGLVPEAASSMILPRLAGRRQAARYLLLGEAFGADEALAIGLASHRAANDQLISEFERLAAALLAKPAEALRQTQALLRRGQEDEILDRMQVENGLFAERLQSEEVRNAITAFFAARSKA